VMKPLVVLLAAAGVGTAAAATTMLTIAGPNAAQNITIGDWNDRRPGPDSSRVARLLTTMGSTDPVACEMLSDQIGNFWWGGDEWGIGRLSDARTDVRAAKDSVSGQVTDPGAIRHLVSSLAADDPCVRRTAAKMLGNSTISDNELARLFDDASPRVREAALHAAGHEERPGLRGRMETALNSRDDATAAMAAWALGNLEMRESVGPLSNALERSSPRLRINAAWALGMIEDGRAVDPLRRVLRDPDPILRATAVSALGDIEAMSSAADVERVLREDSDRRVRLEAINALGNIESMSSLEVLSGVLNGNDVELSIAAIEAIDNLDDVNTAPAGLLRAIGSNVPELRKTAAMALGNIADPNTVDALIGLLRDADADVRMAAVEGLGEIGTPAAKPGLTRALEDSHPEVRRAAIEALAEIEDNENG
jgi:HEAT repeat protein